MPADRYYVVEEAATFVRQVVYVASSKAEALEMARHHVEPDYGSPPPNWPDGQRCVLGTMRRISLEEVEARIA